MVIVMVNKRKSESSVHNYEVTTNNGKLWSEKDVRGKGWNGGKKNGRKQGIESWRVG